MPTGTYGETSTSYEEMKKYSSTDPVKDPVKEIGDCVPADHAGPLTLSFAGGMLSIPHRARVQLHQLVCRLLSVDGRARLLNPRT